jgi:hypothetical protein
LETAAFELSFETQMHSLPAKVGKVRVYQSQPNGIEALVQSNTTSDPVSKEMWMYYKNTTMYKYFPQTNNCSKYTPNNERLASPIGFLLPDIDYSVPVTNHTSERQFKPV